MTYAEWPIINNKYGLELVSFLIDYYQKQLFYVIIFISQIHLDFCRKYDSVEDFQQKWTVAFESIYNLESKKFPDGDNFQYLQLKDENLSVGKFNWLILNKNHNNDSIDLENRKL